MPSPLSFKNFLITSYTKSPTKSLLYASFKWVNLFFAFMKSTILILNNGCNTSRRFMVSTNCSLPSTTSFASYANFPAMLKCNLLSKSFLIASYTTSPTKMSLYASFMYASLSFASMKSTTFILNVADTTAERFVVTTYLPPCESLFSHARPVTPI